MLKNIILKSADYFGYEIRKKPNYKLDKNELKKLNEIRPYTMLPEARLLSLYEQAVFIETNHINGSFVECGVWKGGSVALMALANLKYGQKRRHVHLFDSFQEICEPNPVHDGKDTIAYSEKWTDGKISGKLQPLKGVYDHIGGPGTVEENKLLLEHKIGYDNKYLHYHIGWFQDTLPTDSKKIDDISILRLDGDWYESTKICLEHLFKKVVPGGFVIIDDYGTYEGCKKATDEFICDNKLNVYLNYVDYACRYFIKN